VGPLVCVMVALTGGGVGPSGWGGWVVLEGWMSDAEGGEV
jgi:hypothetical protein